MIILDKRCMCFCLSFDRSFDLFHFACGVACPVVVVVVR